MSGGGGAAMIKQAISSIPGFIVRLLGGGHKFPAGGYFYPHHVAGIATRAIAKHPV